MNPPWTPHVTVAAIVERDAKFLIVEERIRGALLINQPAGHWESGETLTAAAQRETLEETAYTVEVRALIGIYTWQPEDLTRTYLRFAFSAQLIAHAADAPLDHDIERALWLSHEEIAQRQAQHRSPLVLRCIEDYLQGKRYPLELLSHHRFA